MINQVFIIIALLMFLSLEIFCLGKRIAQANSLFINNESAIWILGTIIYFGVSFLFFLPFVWLKISVIYFIIIFIIKDFIIFSYIFLGKEKIDIKLINWKNLTLTIVCSIAILMFFNFNLYDVDNELFFENYFYQQFSQMWFKTQAVLATITGIDLVWLNKWLFGFIGSMVIWSTIHSLMIRFGKKQAWFEYLLSLSLSFLLICFFNFKLNLSSLFPVYLTMFGLFLSLNIVQFSRKRYSFVFIINFLVAWMINYKVFIPLAAISLSSALIYSIMKKPMTALFWVQLLTPILVVMISWTSIFSLTLTFALILVVSSIYCGLIFVGKNKLLLKINCWIYKYAKTLLIFNLLTILSVALLLLFVVPVNLSLLIKENNLILDFNWFKLNHQTIVVLNILQWIVYVLIVGLLCTIVNFWKKHKYKFVGMRIIVLVILTIFLLFYNPVFSIVLIGLNAQSNLSYLRSITFMPLFCFSVIWLHNWLIKKTRIAT